MSQNQEKRLIIDVDKAIDIYNNKNPELRKLTRDSLAKKVGVNKQTFVEWKSGRRAPKAISVVLDIIELVGCEIKDFISNE